MFFCPETAVTTLTASPPVPSFSVETRDLTLVWEYTLNIITQPFSHSLKVN